MKKGLGLVFHFLIGVGEECQLCVKLSPMSLHIPYIGIPGSSLGARKSTLEKLSHVHMTGQVGEPGPET